MGSALGSRTEPSSRRARGQLASSRALVTETPLANSGTSWPSAISSSVSHDSTRSVPPYSFGGTASVSGAICAICIEFDLSFGTPHPREFRAQDQELQSDQMFQMQWGTIFFAREGTSSRQKMLMLTRGGLWHAGVGVSHRNSVWNLILKGTRTFGKACSQFKEAGFRSTSPRVRKSYR